MARKSHRFTGSFSFEEIESVRANQPLRKRLGLGLYLPKVTGEIQAASLRQGYTVERRGSCTVIWLRRGEGRTMIAAFRNR